VALHAYRFTQDWKLDAARRDLTINAMSMDLEGQIYDYFNGEEHLRAGIILFVGAASTRITEDYLRILRYFRFHGRFSHTDTHDAACEQAVIEHCSGLQNISGERIRTEMLKIVKLPASVRLVAAMCRMNVLREIGMQTVSEDALAEFERVVGLSTNAATRVTALASTDEDMQRLVDRWRLTKEGAARSPPPPPPPPLIIPSLPQPPPNQPHSTPWCAWELSCPTGWGAAAARTRAIPASGLSITRAVSSAACRPARWCLPCQHPLRCRVQQRLRNCGACPAILCLVLPPRAQRV